MYHVPNVVHRALSASDSGPPLWRATRTRGVSEAAASEIPCKQQVISRITVTLHTASPFIARDGELDGVVLSDDIDVFFGDQRAGIQR